MITDDFLYPYTLIQSSSAITQFAYNITETGAEYQAEAESTKDTPYLAMECLL